MKNLFKSRSTMMSLLLIGLAAIIIGGATMAWFTDDADVADATFTAGTVIVDADEANIQVPEGKYFDNVTPGDCAKVTWNIINNGTKAVELRAKITEAWEGGLSTDNVFFCPPEDSDWVMYEDDNGDIWLYYTGGPVPGTYGGASEEERTVPLTLVVGFDGELTDNDYQGKEYTLGAEGSIIEAVQASNGAPEAVWGEVWNTVTDPNYDFTGLANAAYFYSGNGNDMPCWNGENNGDNGGGDNDNPQISFGIELKSVKAVDSNMYGTYLNTEVEFKVVDMTINGEKFTGNKDLNIKVRCKDGYSGSPLGWGEWQEFDRNNVSFTDGESNQITVKYLGRATNSMADIQVSIDGHVVTLPYES
ncbi:MAG: hypothetical protein GX088_00595 [Clostridia bacterium]|nr:hypothetical protein [Clostridia bacterium]